MKSIAHFFKPTNQEIGSISDRGPQSSSKDVFTDQVTKSHETKEDPKQGNREESTGQRMNLEIKGSPSQGKQATQTKSKQSTPEQKRKYEKKKNPDNSPKNDIKIDPFERYTENEVWIKASRPLVKKMETYEVYCDGSAIANPGHGGAGFVIFSAKGQEIYHNSIYLGLTTNNVAEYSAVLYGLQAANSLGVSMISVYTDAELVVNQVKGIDKVKDPKMKSFHKAVEDMMSKFSKANIRWIPRESNLTADGLAKKGALMMIQNSKSSDGAQTSKITTVPPQAAENENFLVQGKRMEVKKENNGHKTLSGTDNNEYTVEDMELVDRLLNQERLNSVIEQEIPKEVEQEPHDAKSCKETP